MRRYEFRSKKAKYEYILYSHDDFYFCPGWDIELKNEVDKIDIKNFIYSNHDRHFWRIFT